MDEQSSAANSDAANISTSAVNHPEAEMRGSTAPSGESSGFMIVRLVLGVLLLLITAGLKLFDPSPDTLSALEMLSSPRWHMAAIEVEALLGLWLLTGPLPWLLWLATLFCFLLLASANFYMGAEGQSSCGCFGAKLSVSPWYALALDLTAVASLLCWRPRQGYRFDSVMLGRVLAAAAAAGMILAAVLGVLTWMYGSPSEALLYVRGEFITVEPSASRVGDGVAGEQSSFTILSSYEPSG
jgi:hypothetical protein